MYLKSVKINGFWGRATVSTEFNDGVNILVGINGSGKTTLVNIISSILTADLMAFNNLEFDSAEMHFHEKGRPDRTLIVQKKQNQGVQSIQYKFDSGNIHEYLTDMPEYHTKFVRQARPRAHRVRPNDRLYTDLRALADVRWLSILRYAAAEDDPDWRSGFESPVDAKLSDLQRLLSQYQLRLRSKEGAASQRFQRGVSLMMLYDEDFDSLEKASDVQSDLRSQKDALQSAFEELGVPHRTARKIVGNHVRALERSIESFQAYQDFMKNPLKSDPSRVQFDHLFALPLIKRNWRIVELAKKLDEEKDTIFRPLRRFRDIANDFFGEGNKAISFTLGGEIQINLNNQGKPLDVSKLSSGEKQLLIQLTEILLQEEQPGIFIADEPEISLHVSWQEMLLDSLVQLNPNAQMIIATHSPEIVGRFADGVIQMSEIVHVTAQ